jgi:hypothetical protein
MIGCWVVMRAPDLRDAIEVRAPSTDEGQEHRECAKRTTNLMRGLPPMPRRKGPPPDTSGRTGGGRVRAGGRRQTYPHDLNCRLAVGFHRGTTSGRCPFMTRGHEEPTVIPFEVASACGMSNSFEICDIRGEFALFPSRNSGLRGAGQFGKLPLRGLEYRIPDEGDW